MYGEHRRREIRPRSRFRSARKNARNGGALQPLMPEDARRIVFFYFFVEVLLRKTRYVARWFCKSINSTTQQMNIINFGFYFLHGASAAFGGIAVASVGYGLLLDSGTAPTLVAWAGIIYGAVLAIRCAICLSSLAAALGTARFSTDRAALFVAGFRYGTGHWSLLSATVLAGLSGFCFIYAAYTQSFLIALAAGFTGLSLRLCAMLLVAQVRPSSVQE